MVNECVGKKSIFSMLRDLVTKQRIVGPDVT